MIKYMRHIFIFIVVWLAAGTICSFAQYKPDRLGEGFEAKTIAMPDDYSGRVVTTLVRSLSSCDTHKAVLYVHGYNDYFFQETLARTFNDSCFNFYAWCMKNTDARYCRNKRRSRFEICKNILPI